MSKTGEWIEGLKEFWNEFKKVRFGIVGVALLIFLIGIAIFEPLLLAYPESNDRWQDITYWQNLPMNAPPSWATRGYSKTEELHAVNFSTEASDGVFFETLNFVYNFDYNNAPLDMILYLDHTIPRSTLISVVVTIPDKGQITLKSRELPYGADLRIPLARDNDVKTSARVIDPSKDAMNAIFSSKGDYEMEVTFVHYDEDFYGKPEDAYFMVIGRSHGLFGTDSSRRDLGSGLVAGMKWALCIGLLTAVITVLIGVLFGITSAYYGGWVDSFMQRIYEVLVSIPLLPLMIVISAVYELTIWWIIILMCLFFWTGSQKTVRSIGLQIKEETFIEASKGFGAPSRWIIFKHMFPLLLPYSLASMAMVVPSAIVYEATLSLLGLGDKTIVTWGQILQSAISNGAVINGYWWWVIPPGLAIALVGMTFAFIGFAMDIVIAPRLRKL